MHILTVMLTD